VVLPAVPNTNGGLIENLFLIRKPHTRSCLVLARSADSTAAPLDRLESHASRFLHHRDLRLPA
jgi:hypothetical protein